MTISRSDDPEKPDVPEDDGPDMAEIQSPVLVLADEVDAVVLAVDCENYKSFRQARWVFVLALIRPEQYAHLNLRMFARASARVTPHSKLYQLARIAHGDFNGAKSIKKSWFLNKAFK